MDDLTRLLLERDDRRSGQVVYGVASGDNTVAVRGAATAVELPALIPVRSGDYCAVWESGADRLILGPVDDGWQSYTPSWTNLSVGNGTVSASYRYVPGGIRLVGSFTYGSTSSISGNVTQTIPNSHTSAAPAVGGFVARDGVLEYTCSTQVFASNSAFLFYGQTGNWAAANPFAPATSDEFIWDITIPL